MKCTPRAFFDSVETEERGKALFEKAWHLREAPGAKRKALWQPVAEVQQHSTSDASLRVLMTDRPARVLITVTRSDALMRPESEGDPQHAV
ncbi:MAG: hypothetical protein O2930_03625 [Acidobacteria bacterium]|nr:hypothetical protein [Acidobacteriota bacterium]